MLPFSLVGFEIQQITVCETTLTITACAVSPKATCPSCQQVSHCVHSYYTRSPADLPVSGETRPVGLARPPLSLFESAVCAANVCGANTRSDPGAGATNNPSGITAVLSAQAGARLVKQSD